MEAEVGTSQSQQKPGWQGQLGKIIVIALAIYGGYQLFTGKVEKDAAVAAAAAGAAPAAAPSAPEPVRVEPAVPVAPTHLYSLHENGEYGYEAAISDDDRKRGTVTQPLLMVRYLGKHNSVQSIEMRDGAMRVITTCSEPCEFMKRTTYFNGMQMGEERVRNVPGSIMNAIMQDAMSGQLEPFRQSGTTEATQDS